MKLKKYINDCFEDNVTPFISSTMIGNEASFVYDSVFQSDLSDYIYRKHGNKEISEMVLEEVADHLEKDIEDLTTEDIYSYIIFICDNIYKTNQYKYNTLEATTHLDYNPIHNYNRYSRNYATDTFGEQQNSHIQGSQSTEVNYGKIEHKDEYGELNKQTIKGEQEDITGHGVQGETYIKGEQKNVDTHGDIDKNLNKGSQSNSDTIGEHTDSITHGATKETNTYGDKLQRIGAVVKENEYGERDDTVGEVIVTDNVDNRHTSNVTGATHFESEDCLSVGISPYDDNSEFGNTGIKEDSNGNYILNIVDGGDGAYHPKERDYRDHTENTKQKTDSTDTNAYEDTHTTSEHTDTTGSHTDVETISEHSITDVGREDVKSTLAVEDSTTVGSHTDNHIEGSRIDTEHLTQDDDEHTVGERKDISIRNAYNNTLLQGERTDSDKVNAHTDNHIQGSHSDNTSVGERTDTDKIGKKRDTHLIVDETEGNIGVMSTQNMIQQERQVALFNIYEIISRDIISQIACTVY